MENLENEPQVFMVGIAEAMIYNAPKTIQEKK